MYGTRIDQSDQGHEEAIPRAIQIIFLGVPTIDGAVPAAASAGLQYRRAVPENLVGQDFGATSAGMTCLELLGDGCDTRLDDVEAQVG